MKKRIKKMFYGLIIIMALVSSLIFIFLRQPQFGQLPTGQRRLTIQHSSHYGNGEFQNQTPTPMLNDGKGFFSATWEYLFTKKERLRPQNGLPHFKTDLKKLDRERDVLIWLGHSSFYIQLGGRSILIDPVFSDYAAPVSFVNKSFPGTSPYSAADFPEIDYLLITHDHWDHLDYPTIMALPKIGRIITGLGTGAHFERWGFSLDKINEGDWGDIFKFDDLSIHLLPARHFSGRALKRNQTLWTAFAIITDHRRIFLSGDSGYGPHFKDIGEAFGGFDLAALDTGQYDEGWPYVHMKPEEAAQAALDLKAAALLPAHIGKFSIANHSWDDPFIRIEAASREKDYRLLTPLLCQPVFLDVDDQVFEAWWKNYD